MIEDDSSHSVTDATKKIKALLKKAGINGADIELEDENDYGDDSVELDFKITYSL